MKTIKIGKSKYEVVAVTTLPSRMAEINYATKVIKLASTCGYTKIRYTKKERREAFWHEVVHGILKDMRNPLEGNEKFVEAFSERLTGVITQVHPNERNLVAQFAKRVRELPPQISRNKGAKKVSVRKNGSNAVRGRATQSR
jgi:hypothetical protein